MTYSLTLDIASRIALFRLEEGEPPAYISASPEIYEQAMSLGLILAPDPVCEDQTVRLFSLPLKCDDHQVEDWVLVKKGEDNATA